MILKLKLYFLLFLAFLSKNISAWSVFVEPFGGYQYKNPSTISLNSVEYSSDTKGLTYGSRLGLTFFDINFGVEYYRGSETNTRQGLEDKWDKSNLGFFISNIDINEGYLTEFDFRITYYFSPEKTLVEDNNAGAGDLNDKATGQGLGLGAEIGLFFSSVLHFDYRYITYTKIGTLSLPTSTYSTLQDHEIVLGLSVPLIYNF